jgi:rubrerythrin
MWKIAREIESEGKRVYEAMARDAPTGELAGAFRALAEEEQRHFELFKDLEKNTPLETFAMEPLLSGIPEFFREIVENLRDNDDALKALNDAEHICRKALVLEYRSIDFYQIIISTIADEFQRGIVDLIIDQETHHISIIEGLIDFVHRPKEWVENAEFCHQEEC